MEDFIITSGSAEMEVVSHGTLFTNDNGNRLELVKYHKAKQGTSYNIGIVINFTEAIGHNATVGGGDVGLRELRHAEMFHTYEFTVSNVTGDRTVTIERQQCANYPGGQMFISFTAFAAHNNEKGIHYTIWKWEK